MKLSKRLVLILAPLVLYAVAAIVWVCVSLAGSSTGTGSGGGGGGIVEGDYEFVFSGSVETNTGRTFTLALTGNKDEEQTLDLTVQEMPALSIDGNWTFTENKGYKIFLNDANGTFATAGTIPTRRRSASPSITTWATSAARARCSPIKTKPLPRCTTASAWG